MNESENPDQSRYEPLVTPEFESDVPEYIVDGLSKKDRHVTESLSIIQQQNAWLIANVVAASKVHRDVDLRIWHLESWKASLTSRVFGILAATVIAPLIVSAISYLVLQHYKP